ncbi:HAD family hydrolase [Natronolimnobius baerhuensis]|uniref:Haloacid dehalogenase n=1 Tax=Natronolimnobius baerhuensis TaxID=253108 RepID=A0A202EAY0_9EURY|nr:HAD family hydrolase [Natronolimnobius baerhuensis]OVE85399.1 haloacid dehalogenase [Natronolimnobius baerhuensis]
MTAIVFDLDGTVLRTVKAYRDVLADAITSVRGDAPDAWLETYTASFLECFAECEPEPIRRTFARIDDCDDPERYATALLEAEIESFSPPPDARRVLEELSAADTHDLGVLTNGVRDWQLAKLRGNDLEQRFDAVVASYDVGAHKPAEAPYRELETRLPADRYVMVGDSDSDIEGAQAAGWDAIRYDGGSFEDVLAAIDSA